MSDEEPFLTRWSRRKREARPAEPDATPELPAAPTNPEALDPPAAGEPAGIDPSVLPPIESIGAGTDIRVFLQPGVPAELARAALRRAWVADPAIRDFVGPAENAWDFNAPGGVPGFAPLASDEVKRLAAQLFGDASAAAKDDPAVGAASGPDRPAAEPSAKDADVARIAGDPAARPEASMPVEDGRPTADPAAIRNETATEPDPERPARRRHGGALPE